MFGISLKKGMQSKFYPVEPLKPDVNILGWVLFGSRACVLRRDSLG